jgi:hypothetical protein
VKAWFDVQEVACTRGEAHSVAGVGHDLLRVERVQFNRGSRSDGNLRDKSLVGPCLNVGVTQGLH